MCLSENSRVHQNPIVIFFSPLEFAFLRAYLIFRDTPYSLRGSGEFAGMSEYCRLVWHGLCA